MDTPAWLNYIRLIVLPLPGIQEYVSHHTPAFRVKKRIIARLWDDGEVLAVYADDRDKWLNTDPEVFFITDYYLKYPMVLVRLNKISDLVLKRILTEAWQQRTKKPESPQISRHD